MQVIRSDFGLREYWEDLDFQFFAAKYATGMPGMNNG
jgi:hypothetical protein